MASKYALSNEKISLRNPLITVNKKENACLPIRVFSSYSNESRIIPLACSISKSLIMQ